MAQTHQQPSNPADTENIIETQLPQQTPFTTTEHMEIESPPNYQTPKLSMQIEPKVIPILLKSNKSTPKNKINFNY